MQLLSEVLSFRRLAHSCVCCLVDGGCSNGCHNSVTSLLFKSPVFVFLIRFTRSRFWSDSVLLDPYPMFPIASLVPSAPIDEGQQLG